MKKLEIVYGFHAVNSAIEEKDIKLLEAFFLNNRNDKRLHYILQKLREVKIPVRSVSLKWLDQKTNRSVHQGIMLYVEQKKRELRENDLKILLEEDFPLFLVLEGITDVRNFGACIRCADAAGVNGIIFPNRRFAKINGLAKKTSSGAVGSIPLIRVTNLSKTIQILKREKIKVIGTSCRSNRTIYDCKFNEPLAIVIGSEHSGIRRSTMRYCDEIVKIPMFGTVDSLNTSVATGIILFEVVRQRMN